MIEVRTAASWILALVEIKFDETAQPQKNVMHSQLPLAHNGTKVKSQVFDITSVALSLTSLAFVRNL